MVWLPHWPVIGSYSKISLGLSRISDLLQALGSPHLQLPPTIHVAGTNGKGSTIAFMKSILEEAGLKVHRYISPHLSRFNERILLAGQEIQDDYLFSLLEECRIASERNDIDVSFFEGITAAAFLAFSRVKADVLLLEVGLGGRLDATNVIESPMLSVITPISYDHEKLLGSTLEKIAYEKACIIKPGCPCVVSMQVPEVYDVILSHSVTPYSVIPAKAGTQSNNNPTQRLVPNNKEAPFGESLVVLGPGLRRDDGGGVRVPLIQYECDFGVSIAETGELEYKSRKRNITTPAPSLPGYHQYINAATAIAAIDHCYSFPDEVFKSGIIKAKWLARLTKIESENFELWVDGAHNESGSRAVAAWLADQPIKETILIFGMTRNRDVNKFLNHFKGLLTKIIAVNIQSEPDSYRAEMILGLIMDKDLKDITTHAPTLNEAFDQILKLQRQNCRIVIAGSLFLASDFFAMN
jgi:dihydrofolate synthase/folylpolyglutamate synthase